MISVLQMLVVFGSADKASCVGSGSVSGKCCKFIQNGAAQYRPDAALRQNHGGQREFVPVLARAAVAVGVQGLFMESHENPDQAPSDGPNMVLLSEMPSVLAKLMQIDQARRS